MNDKMTYTKDDLRVMNNKELLEIFNELNEGDSLKDIAANKYLEFRIAQINSESLHTRVRRK